MIPGYLFQCLDSKRLQNRNRPPRRCRSWQRQSKNRRRTESDATENKHNYSGDRIPDVFGIQIVKARSDVKWFGFQMEMEWKRGYQCPYTQNRLLLLGFRSTECSRGHP